MGYIKLALFLIKWCLIIYLVFLFAPLALVTGFAILND